MDLKNYKCPVCGGDLEYIFHKGEGDSIIIPFWGEIRCTGCGMFSKRITRNNQESYHWNYDGTSEMKLKEEVWREAKPFLKLAQMPLI